MLFRSEAPPHLAPQNLSRPPSSPISPLLAWRPDPLLRYPDLRSTPRSPRLSRELSKGGSSSSHGGGGGEQLALPDIHPDHDRAAPGAVHDHAAVPRGDEEGQDHPLPLLRVPPLRKVPEVDLQEDIQLLDVEQPYHFASLDRCDLPDLLHQTQQPRGPSI